MQGIQYKWLNEFVDVMSTLQKVLHYNICIVPLALSSLQLYTAETLP